ncbi:MAG: hypothetical protein K2Y23_07095 [Cyanobacteria bacterium]|nr:hypothetical protein [Cyanobacteriota bacterium]
MTITAIILILQALIAPPDGVRKELDATCKGWQLAPVMPEIATEIKTRTPTWPPNLLPGDFNGDKEVDVAALIECNGTAQLIAFMSGKSGFSKEVLEKPQPYDAREFLHLIRGEFQHDAIGVEYEAIGGHAWVYRNGRWEKIPY